MKAKARNPKRRHRTDSFVCYSGEAVSELFSYPPSGQYEVLAQAFRERKGVRALTAEERVVLAVTAMVQEVNNGGYDQFFRNSSRKFVPIIFDSLIQVGLRAEAKITQKAIDALHLRMFNVRAINAAMTRSNDERDDRLEECDRSFYKLHRGAARKLYTFLKTNRARIKF